MPTYAKIEHLSVPLVSKGQVLGYVMFDLSLEVGKSGDLSLVSTDLPGIRAAFLIDMTNTPIGKPGDPEVIDYESLNQRLTKVANQELKGDYIKRVLVTQTVRM